MAMSTCVKCNSTSFEIREVTPQDSNFRYNFIQCTKCGGVVGVVDFYNIGSLIHGLADKLNVDLGY